MISKTVRPPSAAGMFYPGDPESLSGMVGDLFNDLPVQALDGPVVGIVSPHAGYPYSGLTAAHGYAALRHHAFDAVIIIAPSHFEYYDGVSIYPGSGYETPSGIFPIDQALQAQIRDESNGLVRETALGHTREHAIEVQLPFLHAITGFVPFVPLVMGSQSREICFGLGNLLGKALAGKRTLLIASTDLSHYHSYDTANQLDQVFLDDVEKFDYRQLMADLEDERTEACGGGPVVAALIASEMLGADSVKILHHCNSGDMTGDRSRVVGYLSAAIIRTDKE